MNTSRVYVGLDKYNQESIYFKLGKYIYQDLVTKEMVSSRNLQVDTFIPYYRRKADRSRTEIKRDYKNDRSEILGMNQLFLGHIFEVRGFLTQNDEKGSHAEAGERKLLKKDALLSLADKNEGIYGGFIDLEDGSFYPYQFDIQTGDVYIPVGKDALRLFAREVNIEDSTLEKAKVLSKYREFIRGE